MTDRLLAAALWPTWAAWAGLCATTVAACCARDLAAHACRRILTTATRKR